MTPRIATHQASLSITNSRSSLRLTSIELVMPSSHLILCRPLLLLPPIPPSIRVFSNESTLRMRWPEYWSFSFSIIPSKEHTGLISFRMDWLLWSLIKTLNIFISTTLLCSDGKESLRNAGDLDLIPGSEKFPEGGNGYLLQYSCLENPIDRGAWQSTVHGVAKSWIPLSN